MTKIYLKEDGQKIVLESILSSTFKRKHVFDIADLSKTEDMDVVESIRTLKNETVPLPLSINNEIFILNSGAKIWPESDKGIFKAVINGHYIDTNKYTSAS